MKGKSIKKWKFDDAKERLSQFLINFEDPTLDIADEPYDKLGRYKYQIIMQKIANKTLKVMEINIEDLEEMLRKEEERTLLNDIKTNVDRYINIFYDIVSKQLPPRNTFVNTEEAMRNQLEFALENQRKENMMSNNRTFFQDSQQVPEKMSRSYHVIICYKTKRSGMVKSIRQLRSDMVGHLVVLKGIVIRTDSVKPRLSVATFTCDVCGSENYMEILNDQFNPLTQCHSNICMENRINGKVTFIIKHSHFIASQQIKIQQTPDQLVRGNIPRNMKLILTESNIKKAQPGDIIEIQGVLMTKRREGWMHEQDLVFDMFIQAFKVQSQKQKYADLQITPEDRQKIQRIRTTYSEEQIFIKLSRAIAPEIYGLDCVKRALLLLLAGGVTTVTHDRLKIRGQINIMLCGDPGVAKSQLLKHISYISPRGVYTTGKGSSDVGLTAAIKIDPVTKDVSLEAGALVLADFGVCCIDQFDKMTEYDRTAIHEVMEQQTVSIAKAGITTSLNARTSVLAAANPLFSRYNPNQTPQKNINLPAALLSRFDLIFILLDTPNESKDLNLAHHIGQVHKLKELKVQQTEFDSKLLRNYIALSKAYEPKINEELTSLLIERYVKKRTYYADRVKQGERYITTRNLLALVRLCQAKARLRFSNEISKEDILECQQIMLESQKNTSNESEDRKELKDDISSIFSMIKDLCGYKTNGTIDLEIIQKRVLARGFSLDNLEKTIKHYENLNVLMTNKNGTLQIIL